MSLSQPSVRNPSVRNFRWKGGSGLLTYWDKEAEKEVEVELPFGFSVLDELNCISGFNASDQSGYYSNEVRILANDDIVVKSKSGTKFRGLYAKIKDEVKANGGKYAKSLYVAFKDETGELVIGNLKLSGASLTAWIEYTGKYDPYKCASVLIEAKSAKKGATHYFMPVFDGQNIKAETLNEARKLDVTLQQYLKTYLARVPDDTDNDDNWVTAAPAKAASEDVKVEDAGEVDLKANGAANEKINVKNVDF